MNKFRVLLGISLGLLLPVTVLAADRTERNTANAGFLSDYSQLKPVEGRDGVLRYVDKSIDIKPYDKLYIEQVQVIVTAKDSHHKSIQPEAMQRIADTFRSAFIDAVSPAYSVLSEPTADALHVRLAITGIQPADTPRSATDFIPIKALFNLGRSVAGKSPKVAEMSGEMEVLDGQGHIVLANISTRKSEATLPQNDRITWQDLIPIAQAWAHQFRLGLDTARGLTPPKDN